MNKTSTILWINTNNEKSLEGGDVEKRLFKEKL